MLGTNWEYGLPQEKHQLFFFRFLGLEACIIQGITAILLRKHLHKVLERVGNCHTDISHQNLFAFFHNNALFVWTEAEDDSLLPLLNFLRRRALPHFHVIEDTAYLIGNLYSRCLQRQEQRPLGLSLQIFTTTLPHCLKSKARRQPILAIVTSGLRVLSEKAAGPLFPSQVKNLESRCCPQPAAKPKLFQRRHNPTYIRTLFWGSFTDMSTPCPLRFSCGRSFGIRAAFVTHFRLARQSSP